MLLKYHDIIKTLSLFMVEFVSFTLEHKDEANGSLIEKLINRINHPSDDVRMM